MTLSPHARLLAIAVMLYGVMGSARGVSGVAMNTSLMEQVPKHFMGRVQNTFYFVGTFLQITISLTVGWMAQKISLAGGFAIIGAMYLVAFLSAMWPASAEPSAGSTPVLQSSNETALSVIAEQSGSLDARSS
jgi:hypothetical protein